ncbi:uncharacterized protein LOC116955614 [Petromyzon marinus]|uniref:uncharacterized protein LOC116955614 n=1 Tax=Petromyzon marinus TaxID=7757 RepID=UPI003F707FF4
MVCGARGSRSLASPDVRASSHGADVARGTRLTRLVITAQSPRPLSQQRNDASPMKQSRDAYLRIDGVALALKLNPSAARDHGVSQGTTGRRLWKLNESISTGSSSTDTKERPPRNAAPRAQARAPAPMRGITAGSLMATPSLPPIAIGGSSKSSKSSKRSKRSIRAWAIAAKRCLKSYHEQEQPRDAPLKIYGVAMVLRPTPRAACGHGPSQKLPSEESDPPSRQESKELKKNVSFARCPGTATALGTQPWR